MNQLSPEEKAVGKGNFLAAVGSDITRREFLWGSVAAGAVSASAMGGFYFNYSRVNNPVRVGVIGTGDEGGVLMSNITPDYLQVVAISDIRPYNVWRAFHGDPGNTNARMGLIRKYGWSSEDEARKHVQVYHDYRDLLKNSDVEMVIIALPLHLHHPVAIEALRAGKHVLTEKLMAHNIAQCKEMSKVAVETGKLLAVGHQRHYSVLYDNAVHMIRQGLIGQVHHIRAQWHRAKDTWSPPLPDEIAKQLLAAQEELKQAKPGVGYDNLQKKIALLELKAQDTPERVQADKHGYVQMEYMGKTRTAMEELLRWRLWNRTGGGLMAELGSHQLDASSIFISASRPLKDGKPEKVMPETVTAVGGIHLYDRKEREVDDHVYCTYEFPGPDYATNPDQKIVVTYSSINGNGFGGYGEVVMGDKGTLVLATEQEVMLYRGHDTAANITVEKDKDKKPTMASNPSPDDKAVSAGNKLVGDGPPSRGYTEEMEHFAYCLRNGASLEDLRCNPKVAMADAIIALTTNIAMRQRKQIKFRPEWFDLDHPATPEKDLLEGST